MGSTLFSNNESISNDLNFKDLLRGLIDTESCKEGEKTADDHSLMEYFTYTCIELAFAFIIFLIMHLLPIFGRLLLVNKLSIYRRTNKVHCLPLLT